MSTPTAILANILNNCQQFELA